MNFRLHLHDICCVITTPKSYLQMQQYQSGPRQKIVNKVEAFRSGLSRLKLLPFSMSKAILKLNHSYDSAISVDSIFTQPKLIVDILLIYNN